MRIIYVTASLPSGTQEAFIIAEINELVGLGHEVLVVPRSPRGLALHGQELQATAIVEHLLSLRVLGSALKMLLLEPHRVAAALSGVLSSRSLAMTLKNLSVLPKALWLACLARKWNADHIHCHWAATTATMALVASKLSAVRWSFTAHRWDIVENNVLAAKAQSASFVRVISDETRRMVEQRGVAGDEKLQVLRMGVRMPQEANWEGPAAPVLLCPANLVEVKGHSFLLEAWRILQTKGMAGELWLAGAGELESELRAVVKKLKLSSSVKLLGAISHEDLLRLYETRAIAAVVLASIDLGNGCHEGIPVALIEAMSYGVPVVSTSTGAIGELVLPGTGLLVPQRDPAALANAIEQVMRDKALAKQLGIAGRRRAEQAHNVATIARTLAKFFAAAQ